MLNEFKAFIARGNVVDLAVGIIIGAAFTAIVNSLVADLVNPLIGVVTGGIDFSNLFINLGEGDFTSLAAARAAGGPGRRPERTALGLRGRGGVGRDRTGRGQPDLGRFGARRC